MSYEKRLPRISRLLDLVERIDFPATGEQIAQSARRRDFSGSVLDFLRLFSAEDIFKNRDDFRTRCEELELLIREERKMPKEAVLAA